jgi:excisionase family DNA binding protein
MKKLQNPSAPEGAAAAEKPADGAFRQPPADAGPSRLLDEYEVATWLSISVRTLRNWRVQGGHIPFIRVGRKTVRYQSSAIESWLASRVRTNTTDKEE